MTDSNLLLRSKLSSLGYLWILDTQYCLKVEDVEKNISDYVEHFKLYNPRKKNYNRYGLSLTSKDGGFSGIPDLDSLSEYNQQHGTNFDEMDFREWTPFFKNSEPLKEIMKPFHNYIGRSHILRLDKGGFFPPHRDLCHTSFRLFISLCKKEEDYVFLLDNKKVFFQPGRLYFINTLLTHSLFSFWDESLFVVFNIELSEKAIQAVLQNLSAY